MKERPILFSAPMVRALLAGTKTQTRRIVKPQPYSVWGYGVPLPHVDKQRRFGVHAALNVCEMRVDRWLPCPYGAPGDRLWVRETWQAWSCVSHERDEWAPITREVRMGEPWGEWIELRGKPDAIEYRADGKSVGPWTPAIHMPRWASRITLEVTGVRVERLHAITEEDAKAEGVERDTAPCDHTRLSCEEIGCMGPTYRSTFAALWHDINGAESWDANPWVWVVEFKAVTP